MARWNCVWHDTLWERYLSVWHQNRRTCSLCLNGIMVQTKRILKRLSFADPLSVCHFCQWGQQWKRGRWRELEKVRPTLPCQAPVTDAITRVVTSCHALCLQCIMDKNENEHAFKMAWWCDCFKCCFWKMSLYSVLNDWANRELRKSNNRLSNFEYFTGPLALGSCESATYIFC